MVNTDFQRLVARSLASTGLMLARGTEEIYQIVSSKNGSAAVWKLIPRSNLGDL